MDENQIHPENEELTSKSEEALESEQADEDFFAFTEELRTDPDPFDFGEPDSNDDNDGLEERLQFGGGLRKLFKPKRPPKDTAEAKQPTIPVLPGEVERARLAQQRPSPTVVAKTAKVEAKTAKESEKKWKKIAKHERQLSSYANKKKKEALTTLKSSKEVVQQQNHQNQVLERKNQQLKTQNDDAKRKLLDVQKFIGKTKELVKTRENEIIKLQNEIERLKQQNASHKQTIQKQAKHLESEINKRVSMGDRATAAINSITQAKSIIKNQQKTIKNMTLEHEESIAKAGMIIDEYFRYKFLEAPIAPEEHRVVHSKDDKQSEPEIKLDEDAEFMQQLQFLEQVCVPH